MAEALKLFWVFVFFLSNPVLSQLDEFFYDSFHGAGNNLSLNGVAKIEKNGMLRLTNDVARWFGRGFYPSPIRFKNSSGGKAFSFSTAFAFAIVPQYPTLGGHGLAFAITSTKELPGALPRQYLGLLNATDNGNSTNHVFAVEFDTVQDFEFNDISDNHTIQAWIDYDGQRDQLNVFLSPHSTKPTSPILSCGVNLSSILKEFMYVGFSASTGLLASSHYVLGWRFKMNGVAESLDLSSLPKLPGPKRNNTPLIIGVSVAATSMIVFAVALAFYLIRKIKNADVIEAWELDIGPHRFSYQELKKATRGFRDKELIGFGGFGKVYKGTLRNSNTQVAVKRISHESKQGMREFVSEIASIGRLRHRNLVQLLGWCRRRGDLLLVYDYMPNGSLDKLGDFGLAKLYEHGSNPSTTRVVGTLGYLAPELTRTGKPTRSSDVFAFGALLLEVVCGRRPVEAKALPEELILVDWVWERWREGAILDVVDPRLKGEYDEVEVVVVLKLGLMCSNNSPAVRPSMRQVLRYLEGEVALPEELSAPDAYDKKGGDFISGNDSFHFNLNFIRHPILLSHPNFTQAITGLIPRLHSVVGSLKNAT
ncbi:unnamed protein product, partial [Vitis vinifera]